MQYRSAGTFWRRAAGPGVRHLDAFWRHLNDPGNRSYDQGFSSLAANGVPFARLAASAYWPSELRLYQTDRATYLSRLDDVVARYRNSPAVWAWEFGNEFSLTADLPNGAEYRPPIVPSLGTPATRSSQDDLTTPMILTAFQAFAAAVGALDRRPVITGNSLPRFYAERLRLTGNWGQPDSRSDFKNNFQLINPTPACRVASIHLYASDTREARFFWTHHPTYEELLELSSTDARGRGQALFVGEFGASDVLDGGPEAALQANREIIESLVRERVPLSALWVFDYAPQDTEGWNTTYSNSRRPILQAIQDANQRFRDGACTGS